jgi:hypothetical protein
MERWASVSQQVIVVVVWGSAVDDDDDDSVVVEVLVSTLGVVEVDAISISPDNNNSSSEEDSSPVESSSSSSFGSVESVLQVEKSPLASVVSVNTDAKRVVGSVVVVVVSLA